MACLEHQSFLSPRISFSNDFIDPNQTMIKRERSPAPPPDASDFEFSVSGHNMIAADEIFFKGRLMPLKENCTTQLQRMTLGDKLLCVDDDDDEKEVSRERPVRGPVRWKELLGLRKSGHGMTKKQEVERSPLGGRSSSFIISNVTASTNKASSQVI